MSMAKGGEKNTIVGELVPSLSSLHKFHLSSSLKMTPEELLEAYYYQGLNKGDSGELLLKEILEEDIKFRGVFGHKSKRGVQAVLDYFRAARNALGKYTFEIEDMIVSKDDTKASVRVVCRGVHKNNFFGVQGSGHEVHFTAAAFFQFRKTDKLRISEFVVVGNLDELKRQIGADTSHDVAFQIPTSIDVPSSSSTMES